MVRMAGDRSWSLGNVLRVILLVLALGWSLFPLYWMAVTAFKSNLDIFKLGLSLIPQHPTFENFLTLFNGRLPMGTYFINSVITAVATMLLTIVVSILAAYALSRMEFRGKEPLQLSLLTAQMFPLVVLLIPLYLIFFKSGLLNTNQGLVLAFSSFAIPVGVWFMKGFMDGVPRELDEAAKIDGCNDLSLIRHVLLPVLIPGIVAVGVFAFLDAWNNLVFTLALTTKPEARTLPPGLLAAVDSQFRSDWGALMAGSIIASLPPILLFIGEQRWIMRGLEAGEVKG